MRVLLLDVGQKTSLLIRHECLDHNLLLLLHSYLYVDLPSVHYQTIEMVIDLRPQELGVLGIDYSPFSILLLDVPGKVADAFSDCQLLGKQSGLVLLKQLVDNLLDRDLLSLPQKPDIGFELPIAVGDVVEGENDVVTPFLIQRVEVAPLEVYTGVRGSKICELLNVLLPLKLGDSSHVHFLSTPRPAGTMATSASGVTRGRTA
uniref:Uncharacterized protein n=1 Tax=Chromera velia CCMP2878 TaxID=1169474 RepID=A0A0G4G0M1_9ALVE|eukprot:Cvel_19567.t1-p1 / transcript=Cvel_19567.t1 / gene=Cvel_19567 / organism=Chromera_velia_CCMP2878 / gene_product=hypothetical protein / transcript_product=hypothetical protein / location=Cvel_scaffold1697:9168-9776(-) / protein_length=203 / sequence_SO=supercontig / SO=protein_coding / is_pseudo=false